MTGCDPESGGHESGTPESAFPHPRSAIDSGLSAVGEPPLFSPSARQNPPLVLVSGLRSVGKSSLVCALWGDSELLPTAEQDCTQVNTLIREPARGEEDRGVRRTFLPRARALEFATRDLAYHRLAVFLGETLGPLAPNLDALPPGERLRRAVDGLRELFARRKDLLVLHDHLNDDADRVEEFLAFVASSEYREGQTVPAGWEQRRELLMGQRRPDGRPIGTGRMLAVARVELLRHSPAWTAQPVRLMDSPWVPSFHNARRAELLIEEARQARAMVIVARAAPYRLEDWASRFLAERRDLAARTLVVFNQVDTIDLNRLFARDGFADTFADNARHLKSAGILPENLLVACTRLPFLERSASAAQHADRLAKLREVLASIRRRVESAPRDAASALKPKLLRATDADGGLEEVRGRLMELLRDTGVR